MCLVAKHPVRAGQRAQCERWTEAAALGTGLSILGSFYKFLPFF